VRHGDPLAVQVAEQGRQIAECRRELAAVHATLHHYAERGRESTAPIPGLSLVRSERHTA
jgi:hypothetical protein